jgi:translation initiation factor eIF-2B subunit epsilon
MSKQGGRGGAAAAKGKKSAKPGAGDKREDVLQAVILADSFQDRFKPFTLEKPRVGRPVTDIDTLYCPLLTTMFLTVPPAPRQRSHH